MCFGLHNRLCYFRAKEKKAVCLTALNINCYALTLSSLLDVCVAVRVNIKLYGLLK